MTLSNLCLSKFLEKRKCRLLCRVWILFFFFLSQKQEHRNFTFLFNYNNLILLLCTCNCKQIYLISPFLFQFPRMVNWIRLRFLHTNLICMYDARGKTNVEAHALTRKSVRVCDIFFLHSLIFFLIFLIFINFNDAPCCFDIGLTLTLSIITRESNFCFLKTNSIKINQFIITRCVNMFY